MNSSSTTRMGYVPLNGTDLYFETKGAGKALLLIHAGVADRRMWDHQFEEFSKSHFVIRCDLRGFGQTGNRPAEFAHYEDIADLLRYLQVESVYIIGASFGGSVAIDFALAHPEMVTALVLAAPALGGYRFESPEILNFFEAEDQALEANDAASATTLNLKMWVDGFDRQPGDVSAEMRERVREMQFNVFSQAQGEGGTEKKLSPPAMDRLHKIACPTLVMIGEHDAAEFRSIADQIARQIPNARHVIIPGTAHLPNMEKPEEFNRLVLVFLGNGTFSFQQIR